jgi:hypothetical protein
MVKSMVLIIHPQRLHTDNRFTSTALVVVNTPHEVQSQETPDISILASTFSAYIVAKLILYVLCTGKPCTL